MMTAMREMEKREPVTRRVMIGAVAAAATTALFYGLHRPLDIARAATLRGTRMPATVTIVAFGANDLKTGISEVATVQKPDDEWQKQLSPLGYSVTRHSDTEPAFTSTLVDEHRAGMFRCVCCDTALFPSETKFESGTGWPSFWKPVARENVSETRDGSFGMERTAVSCMRCDAHLGHVFDDGPKPTGLRYCMNGAAMRFVARA